MCTYPVQPVCTSLSSLLFILLFIKSHILFLHILLVLHILFCTFLYSITHFTLYFFFLPIYICSCVVLLLYNFYSLHCPLSGPDLIYISLLIIPCIIYHVTNKETLKPKKLHPYNIKSNSYVTKGLIKAFWSELMHVCKKHAYLAL